MAKLVIIFACVAIFHAATALECYNCDENTCKEPQEKWQKATCGKSAIADQDPACQRLSYKDKSGKDIVKRHCATAPKTGEATCTHIEGATDVKCPTCKTDLCNSASNINVSYTALAGIVMVVLSYRYFL